METWRSPCSRVRSMICERVFVYSKTSRISAIVTINETLIQISRAHEFLRPHMRKLCPLHECSNQPARTSPAFGKLAESPLLCGCDMCTNNWKEKGWLCLVFRVFIHRILSRVWCRFHSWFAYFRCLIIDVCN